MSQTAYLWSEKYTFHEMGYLHPENPRRLLVIRDVLEGDGVGRELIPLAPREATEEEIAAIHEEPYIRRVRETAGKELTPFDPDTSANAYTWESAIYAAGGTIVCADAVLDGAAKNAYAFVRPPGHHAEAGRAMGFCIFNNIAIAAKHLVRARGFSRVAIVDVDVHHGNGTQQAFYDRPDVFFASVHRYPFYPGQGSADERGAGAGEGATLNVPLEVGADDDDYKRALGDVIVPAVERFQPEFLLVSAGYDIHITDPLGGMAVTTKGLRWIMRTLAELARECCAGKFVVVLEGGYNLKTLPECVEAQLEEMAGA